ncbi:MAG: hypothetical protein DMG90_04215, partial [Acidobacteria bacterium]
RFNAHQGLHRRHADRQARSALQISNPGGPIFIQCLIQHGTAILTRLPAIETSSTAENISIAAALRVQIRTVGNVRFRNTIDASSTERSSLLNDCGKQRRI